MDMLILAGVIFLFLGIVLIIIGTSKSSTVKVGVGGFIGPIPFGFANSPLVMYIIIGLMAFTMIIWYLLRNLG